MEECYETGLKVGKDYYMEDVVKLNDEIIRRWNEGGNIPRNVTNLITSIIMKSRRSIPKNIFNNIDYLSAFIRGLYNGSKRYKKGEKRKGGMKKKNLFVKID